MEKQKKSYGKTALIVLLLIVTIASLVLATYAWAKYTSTESGTATAQVAKWDIGVEFTAKDFEETYTHVIKQRLAPGTSGKFDITLDPGSTEVGFEYEFAITAIENAPKHLKFFADAEYTEPIKLPDDVQSYSKVLGGIVDVKEDKSALEDTKPITRHVYWVWPYDKSDAESKNITVSESDEATYDKQDTEDGSNATEENPVKITFTVKATQLEPDRSSNSDKYYPPEGE